MSARIIAARRTAVAPRGGALSRCEPHELGAAAARACLDDAGLAPEAVDELIAGNALGAGGNPARLIALAAGLPERVAGLTVDRQCAGGLDALLLAAALIGAGQAEAVLAGGAESYSRRPLRLRTDPGGGAPLAYDSPPFTPWPERDPDMAEAADRLGVRFGIGQEEQDDWAIESHGKALAARRALAAEIVPLAGLGHDTFARALTPRHCARAPRIAGTVTAANAAVAADAGAFCLVVSDALARRLGAHGPAIAAGATRGGDPELPGLAPVGAIAEALERAGTGPAGLDRAEIMEAYAVQAIACCREAGLDPAIVNRGGGALARGHPVGASGAVLAVRLFHEMPGRGPGARGLAAIAAAGGIGTAMVLAND